MKFDLILNRGSYKSIGFKRNKWKFDYFKSDHAAISAVCLPTLGVVDNNFELKINNKWVIYEYKL